MTVGENETQRSSYSYGFTIVELLIVIVVIGILAAITIVAYGGIQQKARVASLQSDLRSTATTLATYSVTNNDQYPSDLASANLKASPGTSYQYSVNNSTSPATYCVTATNGSTSYFINNTTATTATTGGCPGDGVGGVAAITNLATNPSIETNNNGWSERWYGAGGGSGATTWVNAAAFRGGLGFRKTWTVGGGGQDIGYQYIQPSITAGQTYTFSAYIRSSVVTGHKAFVQYQDASSTTLTTVWSGEINIPANTWQRLSITGVAPASTVRAVFVWGPYPVSGTPTSVAGQTLDFDGLMITQGSTLYNYADGSSPNWKWNGTPNASTSTGPAL